MLRGLRNLMLVAAVVIPCAAWGQSTADLTVEQLRAEWAKLNTDAPLSVGDRLYVAADIYTSNESAKAGTDVARGKALSDLATRAAALGEAALAIRLATEAVHADTNCESARAALGYTRHNDQWMTPYQARMAERGLEWHAEFGWISPEDLPRYQNGERKHRRRWITAEADAKEHAAIENGWQIRTDHFAVNTNHSPQAGVALASKLETLYQVWWQLFADFAIDDAELRQRFELHRVPGVRSRPFQVIYHRTRDEYNTALLSRQPRIAETIGIYFNHQREAHFFYDGDAVADDVDATLYHESVHQLFQESTRTHRDPGGNNNFWVIEGIATWFESLRRHDADDSGTCFTIGEADAGRLPAARKRRLEDGYRVSLSELTDLGKRDFQARTDLAPLYSQGAGLATFLMADAVRRGAFVAYLRLVYDGTSDPASLSQLLETPYGTLDTEYEEFLRALPN